MVRRAKRNAAISAGVRTGTGLLRSARNDSVVWTLFTEGLPWLRGEDRELVMGRALCDWLGWEI
jgi:hypothetical protein